MPQMTVKELKESLDSIPDNIVVVFQGNVNGGFETDSDDSEPTYTTCLGYAYSAFQRGGELVIDCAITESEL